MSKLVIIESPGKRKKIKECLGPGYEVLASVGHCIDLPKKKLGINIKKDFEPQFEIIPDKEHILRSIKKAAIKAEIIYIFTDDDREGCAIGYHISNYLNMPSKIKRIKSNQITKAGIQTALANPGELDPNQIEAYLARRLLDRLVGYRSSYLTQQSTGGRSAGRVQSAILRIIVDREIEIQKFKPVEYWVLTAHFVKTSNDNQLHSYTGLLTEKIKVPDGKTATDYYNKIKDGSPVVTSVESKDAMLQPYTPFITSTMQQTASTVFGWSASKTMQVAQNLYTEGHITYHRTDSPVMAQESIQACRDHISQHIGMNYLHSTVRTFRAKKGAQEAHECCRVTDICQPPATGMCWPMLSGDHSKLYDMIWRRTIATQMSTGHNHD